jgi:16S rRNA (guanine527-N7)-methyltransferase
MVGESAVGLLASGAAALGVNLDSRQLERFEHFFDELIGGNRRANLTAITSPEDVQVKHFVDSLTVGPIIRRALPEGRGRLVDVGSGAGFPGVPLAIAYPGLDIALVEATAKKAAFLGRMRELLGLANVTVLSGRAELLAREPEYREAFDIATARAVGSVATLVELMAPFLVVGGLAVLMKTHAALADELPVAEAALDALHMEQGETVASGGPGMPAHALLILRKAEQTPTAYPRRPGVPGRRPLTR